MIQKECAFVLVLVLSCSALHADPDSFVHDGGRASNRWDVGRLSLEETDDLEYYGEGHRAEQVTYVEVVDYRGCDPTESFATEFVYKVIRDEVQELSVRQFEVGCWERSDGSRVVSVLQTYAGGNVGHHVFLYELSLNDSPGDARKICDFPEASYDLADLEMTGSGDEPAMIAFISSASTGQTTLSVWGLGCSKVIGTDLLDYRVIEEEDSRGIVTMEYAPGSRSCGPWQRPRSCGRLVRRFLTDDEVVKEEPSDDPEDAERLQTRMWSLFHNLDLGVQAEQD